MQRLVTADCWLSAKELMLQSETGISAQVEILSSTPIISFSCSRFGTSSIIKRTVWAINCKTYILGFGAWSLRLFEPGCKGSLGRNHLSENVAVNNRLENAQAILEQIVWTQISPAVTDLYCYKLQSLAGDMTVCEELWWILCGSITLPVLWQHYVSFQASESCTCS